MTRRSGSASTLFVLTLLATPGAGVGQAIALGSELQVNTYTAGAQRGASVARIADGGFVVAWQSYLQDGSGYGVFARLFSSGGAPLTGEFQVNAYTDDHQRYAAVAGVDASFVVAWQSYQQDGSDYGVFARLFSSAGAPLTGEFQVTTYTSSHQQAASVWVDADGDFVVAWQSDQDGSAEGILARLFSSAGAPLTSEFQANAHTVSAQRRPAVTGNADGDFIVAWDSYLEDGSGYGVFARLFSSAGAPLAGQFQINAHTDLYQFAPSVAAAAGGGFVVAWESYGQDDSDYGVFARLVSSAGVPLAGEFQVNAYTPGRQRQPSVAADAAGDFVVAWESRGPDDVYARDVFARRFSSAGAPLTGELQVNTYTTGTQGFPSVAASSDGDFVVVWTSFGQDGASYGGVFAQRFGTAIALDIDGNGAVQALADGLLVLRRFFGLGGTALTSGVVGAGCTRCDAAAIEPYIGSLDLVLDIDGNGSTQALADGLLAVRYLFGLRGAPLTSGVVGAGCTRCDAMTIEPYIDGLVE